MRNSSLTLGLAALLIAAPTAQATATESDPLAEALTFVRNIFHGIATADDATLQDEAPQRLQSGSQDAIAVDLNDLTDLETLEAALFRVSMGAGPELRVDVAGGSGFLGNYTLGTDSEVTGHLLVVGGTAEILGQLDGNLVTVDGDVIIHPEARITGSVLAYNGRVSDLGGEVTGEIQTLTGVAPVALPQTGAVVEPLSPLMLTLRKAAGLVGVFLSLVVLGFGSVMFARPNLEVVSDTITHSFGRSFMVGLLGEVLLLPTFGMVVVGLVLSVAGVLLLPFAVIVYGLLVILGGIGGYLAVAHAMGETYTRRRMAAGVQIKSPNSYRYLIVGLIALLSLWAAWVVFGWVPVAGQLIQGAAVLVTWLMGTAGFGAALLSRAGLRENFAGRLLPAEAMTDEYLWATPQFGVPAAKRPINRPTPPPQ